MTEREKMLSGKLYDIADKDLAAQYQKTRRLVRAFNNTDDDDDLKKAEILKELMGSFGEHSLMMAPVQFDYGVNTYVGKGCHFNYNLTVLDCGRVDIGDDVFIGPNCTLATPVHPLLSSERKAKLKDDGTKYDLEYAKPIVLEDGVWLASGVIVCGGVTIGKESVIGAGSVVTRDIPSGVFAAGNPCRVIRKITEEDSVYLKKELF